MRVNSQPLCPGGKVDKPSKRTYNSHTITIRFEWDPNKAEKNREKHGVTFEEASTVFYDVTAVQFYDEDHSDGETRYLMLGASAKLRILLVCHCFRQEEQVIRIISARPATKKEAEHYGR